jgi:fructose-bisphosphate aldolase class 1
MLYQILSIVIDIGLGALAYRQAMQNRTRLDGIEQRVKKLEDKNE